ncbi:MAG: FHA domain-containing protein [Planctomycetota bacterium]
MEVALVMFRPDGRHRTFPVSRPQTVIGRGDQCELRIPLGEVSRKHCRITVDAAGVVVSDLGSSNGTYVNGRRIQEEDLDPGDTVKIGSLVFVVQIDGSPSTDELAKDPEKIDASTTRVAKGSKAAALDPTAAAEAGDAEVSSSEGLQIFEDDEEIIDLGAEK